MPSMLGGFINSPPPTSRRGGRVDSFARLGSLTLRGEVHPAYKRSSTPHEATAQKFSNEIPTKFLGKADRIAIFAFEEFPHDSDEITNIRA